MLIPDTREIFRYRLAHASEKGLPFKDAVFPW